MPHPPQIVHKWEPISGIAEFPGDFEIVSKQADKLVLILPVGSTDDLRLTFSDVRSFQVFWDGDGIDHEISRQRPRFGGTGKLAGCVWPLVTVENSRWLAGADLATSVGLAWGPNEQPWQHYSVLASERHINIMARGDVKAAWVAPSISDYFMLAATKPFTKP